MASFALPLSVAPARERPFYLAVVAAAGGAAFALTSAAGGAMAEAAHGRASPMPLLLAGSAALRIGALGAALCLPAPRARPAPTATVVAAPDALQSAA